MKDIMIDIETMGTKPYSVILSIGAVKFDINTGDIGEQFYRVIDVKSSKKAGLVFDFDTVMWWANQPDDVRDSILEGKSSLFLVLCDLMMFIGTDKATLWSNSPSFDLSLIRNACERVDIEPIWQYWQERDVRTISGLNPEVRKNMSQNGIPHHAISDCIYQVKYLVSTLSKLKINS
ncbi:3'-5' exonuclease [Sphingobacterium multivorum]|uniref:3'-5' exonuclease n=1 Tax=Sphingobacterium multivorum TaxID=28454 RepID=UPI00289C53C8|nr:3'-5' exonuclease [Sphingobacterium multivorum]